MSTSVWNFTQTYFFIVPCARAEVTQVYTLWNTFLPRTLTFPCQATGWKGGLSRKFCRLEWQRTFRGYIENVIRSSFKGTILFSFSREVALHPFNVRGERNISFVCTELNESRFRKYSKISNIELRKNNRKSNGWNLFFANKT